MFLTRALLVAIVAISASSCKTAKPSSAATGLEGKYVGWMFIDGTFKPSDGSMGTSTLLELNEDRTYVWTMDTTVMMNASLEAKGTYTSTDQEVRLAGTISGEVDDGYKKGKQSGPHDITLRRENGMLVVTDGKDDPFYYRKENTGPPPLPPELQLKSSDPAAIKFLRDVQKTYASLNSYRDTGTVTSAGQAFDATTVKFSTWFKRPSKFRFETFAKDDSAQAGWVEVTFDGKKTWWYQKPYGATTERTLPNALGIIGVSHGDATTLVPELLLPRVFSGFGYGFVEQYPEITRLPDEKIGAKTCAVLKLKSKSATTTKLWIDLSTKMILRETEEIRKATVNYAPVPNSPISIDDLRLGQRKHR